MPPKHHKKSFRQKCWHFRSWIASAAMLLGAAYPFYETFETVKNAPKVEQHIEARKSDDSQIWDTIYDLQDQIDQLKTNKPVKGN